MTAVLNPEKIIKNIKKKQASEAKSNYTFRLNEELMVDFKLNCERNDVSMASMVEEAIRILVYGNDAK
jgi:hypothetical protein